VDKATGKDYCPEGQRMPVAAVRVGTQSCPANRAVREGDKLTVRFAGCDTRLTYVITESKDWIVFRLDSVAGTRPSQPAWSGNEPLRIESWIGGRENSVNCCGWGSR